MRLEKTRFAYEAIESHILSIGRNALLESFFVQYLLVCFYSEVEIGLVKIMETRLNQISDPKVSIFIIKTNEAMIRRTKKSDINDILKKFGCEEDELLYNEIDGTSIQPYLDAITNRHLVSHSDGAKMTIEEFKKALDCTELIFKFVEQAISK